MTITDKSRWKFFCWIRVVDVTRVVAATPAPPPVEAGPLPTEAPGAGVQKLTFGYTVFGPGGEPPKHQTQPKPLPALSRGQQAVSAEPTGAWAAVNGFCGRDGETTAFDYGPAFLDESDAKDWIALNPDGRKWDSESSNRMLMSFTFKPSGGQQ
jgi:hypothetical protein